MTTVLYFGNELVPEDSKALETVRRIKKELPEVDFIHCLSPEEILRHGDSDVIILDVAKGIDRVTAVDVKKIKHRKMSSLHDFDLGFFMKLMERAGKGKGVKLIALPQDMDCEKQVANIIKFHSTSSSRK
jgi:Ni,Fe-hydrogenase maturation factor